MNVFVIALAAAFTVSVCWAFGTLLFQALGLHFKRFEQELLAGITGAPLLSMTVFGLCVIHLARPMVFLVLGLLLLAPAVWLTAMQKRRESLPPLPNFWKYLFAASFALYALLYLSNCLAPEISPDGSSYHLGLVARYLREHGFVRITTNLYASLSQGVEMLFLFAFAFGRHSAAATVHTSFLFAIPLLILSYCRRIGHPRAGVTAAMLVYLSPVVGIDGVSAYTDVALATTAFALFYLLEIWRERRDDDRLMIPIGLLAGFCFAIKYTGFVAVLYMVAVLLITHRNRGSFPRIVTSSIAASAIALPWLVKNWIWLWNPLSPFFNRWFPNPFVHITLENFWREVLRTYQLPSLKPLFWIVTVTGQTGGHVGPVFLLAPVALLALRYPRGRRCLLAAAFFLSTFPANIGGRFLIPALPFVSLGMAYVMEFSAPLLVSLVAASLLFAWPAIIPKYHSPAGDWHIEHMPWQVALQIDSPILFLERRWWGYNVARKINEVVPDNKTLWSNDPLPESYIRRSVMVNYFSADGEKIEDILQTPLVQDFQPLWEHRFRFSPRVLSHLRIVQTGTSGGDVWNVGEARFYDGDDEINPTHAESNPFPWDIHLAFDHNPVTRWRAWEVLRPGQYIDVIFGDTPARLDRVELYCGHDQWPVRMHLEGSGLEKDAQLETIHLAPGADLRRLATRTIKSLGVDYLLIANNYMSAADMRSDPARWGLREAADVGMGKIYQIQ